MNIQDIRKQYPQYNDLSDQELAAGFHKKFYSDLPFGDFASRIGIQPEAPPTPTPAQRVEAATAVPPASPEEVVAPQPTAAPTPEEAPDISGGFFGDIARQFGGAAISGVADIPKGILEAGAALPRKVVTGEIMEEGPLGPMLFSKAIKLVRDAFGTSLSQQEQEKLAGKMAVDETLLKVGSLFELPKAAEYISELGEKTRKKLEAEISPEGAVALKGFEPTGNIIEAVKTGDFSQLSLGENPTWRGLALRSAEVLGSLAPVITSAILTKSPTVGGVVGGGMAAGEASNTAKDYVESKSDEELAKSSPYYDYLRKQGMSEKDARSIITARAGEQAALLQGTVATFGDIFTSKLITGQFDKYLTPYMRNRLTRIAGMGAVGAVEEGAQEFLEGVATDLGINREVVREIGTDSFANAVLGMLGGGPVGAVRGAISPKPIGDKEQALLDALDKLQEQEEKARVFSDEQRAAGVTEPVTAGGVEPSVSVSGQPTVAGGVAGAPAETGAGGVGVSGVPAGGTTTRAKPQPSPLAAWFTPRADSTPQEKSSINHFNKLQKQPDNPVTQALTALDAAIQKAKDAYTQIADKLSIPSGKDMMGLSARLPQPLAELLKFPSATGSAVRLVNASKDLAAGNKRGSQSKLDSALKQAQDITDSVDKIIADALAAAEDLKVQQKIKKLVEQNAISKGVAARQAEIAAVPMEQRAAKIKEIEDEVRAGLQPKAAPVEEAAPAPTELPTIEQLDVSGIFENELDPARDLLARGNDIYGVDTKGNVTKLNTEADVTAFHEANKDAKDAEFTRGDAGYYVIPKERAAPAEVLDAPTIKQTPEATESMGYMLTRNAFLDGTSDIYHIDPEENVTPVTSLKQLQSLNAEWQGSPDAGFWIVPKAPKAGAPRFSDAEEAKILSLVQRGKISQPVAEAIAAGDLSGALRLLASRLTNPLYKELALRLAELKLPTTIAFDGGRDLTRRQIDYKTEKQQKRLFRYVELTYPDVFNKYFKNYDRAENLEKVYDGLKALRSGKFNMGPVVAEFDDVNKAFDDNIRGLQVAGAYYPVFDAITINSDLATNDTFLHEVLHAATEAILNAPLDTLSEGQRGAREELTRIYKYAVDNIPLDLYGLTDIHEFISEVFTNKAFQERLKKIPYKPARMPVLTRLVQAIFKMIGIDNLAANAMVQATQLFSAVRTKAPVKAGARFAPKGKRLRGPISRTWRTAEQVGTGLIKEVENAIKGHEEWTKILPRIYKGMWGAGNTVFRRSILGFANLRQIDDLTKTKFPQISGAIRIIEQMIADRNRVMTKAGDILKEWTRAQAKSLGQSRLMSRIMLEATIRGVDPDTAPAGSLNPEMKAAWDGLEPQFKEIYRKVRNFYADSVNTMVSEMKRRAMQLPKSERQKVIKEINDKFGPDKLVKPYFPLRRFGNYWFQVGKGNFKEFYEFESPLQRELAFLKRKEELENGNAQQKALAETLRKGNGISELYNQNVGTTQVLKDVQELIENVGKITKPTPQQYKIVEKNLQKQMGRTPTQEEVEKVFAVDQTKKELKESLDQLIYILLPQQSMRKMFINRQSIQGASEDMIRVFATTSVHTAYQQSRFKYAEKFVSNLIAAKQYIVDLPNSDVYDDYIKEVEKRAPTILSNEDTSMGAVVAGKLSDATFYFMLSAPFSAMLNLLGMAAITMPYIGGRYGYTKANAVLLKNLGRYLATAPKRSINPALKGQFLQMEFPSIVEGGKLDPLLQRAADRFIADNDINISQTNDIMDIGGRPSELYTGRYNTVKRAIAALFHQSERLNREVALLSTFELAYDKFLKEPKKDLRGVIQRDAKGDPIQNTPDEAFELAIIEAKDIAGLSLGDFTRQMKPRYFTPPLLSVLTKFKQYSVLATYIVARNFYFTVAAPFRKGEIEEFRRQMEADNVPPNIIEQRIAEADAQRIATYKEGMRRLAGILGVTYLLGGAEAMPFFTIGIGLFVKLAANDDDDEFFDWDNWFRNYMQLELGGYIADIYKKFGMGEKEALERGEKTGLALARGPASILTGGSLTERVSLDPVNLWLRDGRFSPDTRESVTQTIIANAGPVVGLGFNWLDAIDLFNDGQYQRAFEKAAPAIVSKPVSAARVATEGAKTKSGISLVDNLSAWEIAMQAIGLQPEIVALEQKKAIDAKTKEQKIKDKKSTLMDRLWMERDNPKTYEALLESLQKFNEKYPAARVEPQDLIDSFKRRTKSQMEAEAFGAQIEKNLRPEVEPMMGYGLKKFRD